MSKTLEKIGSNAKIAFQNKISNKRKNKVLNYYIQLILKNQKKRPHNVGPGDGELYF